MRLHIPFVDLSLQTADIRSELDAAIASVISRNAFIGGEDVTKFETAFARYLGVSHCVGVGNGTDALHLAVRALGIGAGDEVITVANSFIATSEAITMAGATVVFVDCLPDCGLIDLEAAERAIGPKTKAIIPVHLYGRALDMDAVMALAGRHGLKVIEDVAQAHGAEWRGRKCGTWGEAGCFSFYPGKNLGAFGDAGAVVSHDEGLVRRVRMLANHGRLSKYDHEMEGWNSRLDALQAAILSVKLPYLDAWNRARQAAATIYGDCLARTGLPVPVAAEGGSHVYHLFVTRVMNREAVRQRLADRGIQTGVHYPLALPNLAAYRSAGYRPADFPVASRRQDEILSLPMYPGIADQQVRDVAAALVQCLD